MDRTIQKDVLSELLAHAPGDLEYLLKEVNHLKAELHHARNKNTVSNAAVELFRDWLERTDQECGVGEDGEWSSQVDGRAELVEILAEVAEHG